MNFKFTAFLIAILFIIPAATAQAAGRINAIPPVSPFVDDSVNDNDCNYCHAEGHDARPDVRGMLNHNEDRYAQYLGSNVFPEGFQEKSLLTRDDQNKCPRNRNIPRSIGVKPNP